MFRSALAQRGGDAAEAERMLTKLTLSLSQPDRESLVDLHVPLLTVPIAIAHDVYGDSRLALYYAERTAIVAEAAGDESWLNIGLIGQAIISAESGDRERLESLKTRLIVRRQSRQFREEWVLPLAMAVPLGVGRALRAIRSGYRGNSRRPQRNRAGAIRCVARDLCLRT